MRALDAVGTRRGTRAPWRPGRHTRRPRAATGRACSAISAIAGTGSTLVVDVVPTVAHDAEGLLPGREVGLDQAAPAASARMRNAASTGTLRTFFCPMPSAMAPFSTEECDCSEVYSDQAARRRRASATSGSANSRAAAMRVHGCHGCRVVDDAEEILRQPHPLPQPAERHLLEFGTRRASVFQSMPLTFSAAASISPRMPGPDAGVGEVGEESAGGSSA